MHRFLSRTDEREFGRNLEEFGGQTTNAGRPSLNRIQGNIQNGTSR